MPRPPIRDELDARIRTLQAERLRPVPAARPRMLDDPTTCLARLAQLAEAAGDDDAEEADA